MAGSGRHGFGLPDPVQGRIARSIATHGFGVLAVGPGEEEPPFSYTIGFAQTYGHAEVMVAGLPPVLAHTLLSAVGRLVKQGSILADWSTSTEIIKAHPVVFRRLSADAAVQNFPYAASNWQEDVLGRPLEICKMVLPDPEGLFPWDSACSPAFSAVQGWLLDGCGLSLH